MTDAADSNWFHKNSISSLKDDRVQGMIHCEAHRVAMNKICSWLAEDTVSAIGIYGTPGVGKTTLAKRIYNWAILERPHMFRYAYWISMSPVFSIYELQNVIAKATDVLDISEVEIDFPSWSLRTEEERAELLSEALSKKGNSLLIVDDLHTIFSLEDVGIPTGESGCKLIVTTQSSEACKEMGCQEAVEVTSLAPEEALNLFVMKLGLALEIPSELESIARAIIESCDRLPLEVIAMAGSMKGLNGVHEWLRARNDFGFSRLQELRREWRKSILEQRNLRKSRDLRGIRHLRRDLMDTRDKEPQIFCTLLACYNRLDNDTLQQCLLYCALFPKYFKIKREDLIEYMIAEGIITERECRQEELDEGNAMLDKLESAHLLEGFREEKNQRYIEMHDLVRDMALQIMKNSEDSKAMVETDVQLKELPDGNEWEDLVRVSLMKNYITSIPGDSNPTCYKLSTLLLCRNPDLRLISNSFFLRSPMLKVLDLSGTSLEKLPTSLCFLVHLTALFLKRCKKLKRLPSLAAHRNLLKLDLSYTAIQRLPYDLEYLSNLKYLNLYETRLREFPQRKLPQLSHLQFLKFCQTRKFFPELKGDEVACLRKLEVLQCRFNDIYEFNKCIESWKATKPVRNYNILVGTYCDDDIRDDLMAYYHCRGSSAEIGREVWIFNCSIRSGEVLELPENIQHLVFVKCDDASSLYEIYALKFATQLKSMEIWECGGMESLLSSVSETLENLEVLWLRSLNRLKVLYPTEPPSYECYGAFSSLKTFILSRCPRLKKLFCPGLLSNLVKLEVIEVENCSLLEEIIAMDMTNTDIVSLPKLRILKLKRLPELKSICCHKVLCDTLQEIHIIECRKLEDMPFIGEHDNIPASLKRIQAFPRAWWEWIEWGSPDTKNALQPLCVFDDSDFFLEEE